MAVHFTIVVSEKLLLSTLIFLLLENNQSTLIFFALIFLIQYGDYALHVAIEEGRDEVVKLLLERGADVNVTSNVSHTLDVEEAVREWCDANAAKVKTFIYLS